MSNVQQVNPEHLRFFDSVLAPDVADPRAAETRRDVAARDPVDYLRAMIERPSGWERAMAALKRPETWAQCESAGSLPLAENVVLGLLLARNVDGLSSQVEVSVRAAALWYRSALCPDDADDAPAGVSPLGYYEVVFRPVIDAVRARGQTLALGYALELAFEQALAGDADGRRCEQVRARHAGVMQRMVWPLLRGKDVTVDEGYRLVLSAWVATGTEAVLRDGLVQLLETKSPARSESFRRLVTPETASLLLDVLRRGKRPPGPRLRERLVELVAALKPGRDEDPGHRRGLALLHGLIELLSET